MTLAPSGLMVIDVMKAFTSALATHPSTGRETSVAFGFDHLYYFV